MAKWIPPRPSYKRERRSVGFVISAVFLLSLLARVFGDRVPLPYKELLLPLATLIVALLLPALSYFLFRGRGYWQALRLAPPRREHLPFLIASFFAMLCGSFLLSVLTGGTDTLGNTATAFSKAPAEKPLVLLLSYVILALIPALLEAFFCFGIVTLEYERRGAFRAVLMSTLCFSLIHFDARNIPSYLFVALLSLLALYTTNSLFSVLALNLCYQTFSFFLQPYLVALYRYTGSPQLFFFILVLTLLLSLFLLLRLSARTYRLREEQSIGVPRRAVPYAVQFYTTLDALLDPAVLIAFAAALVGLLIL